MEASKIDIRSKLDWEKDGNEVQTGRAALVKAMFLRHLLCLGREARDLRKADFILRLIPDYGRARVRADTEYGTVEMLADDTGGQYIYVLYAEGRLELNVIPTVYSVEGEEIEYLAGAITRCTAGCRRETDAEAVAGAESISVFDAAACKTATEEFIVEFAGKD